MMDIKNFINGGSWGAGDVILSEERENHKNSTHSKIKFYIIFISFCFPMMDIQNFQRGGKGEGWGRLDFF